MNPSLIQHLSDATLNGTMSFPEIVGQLISMGVEYYYVDYVKQRKAFYNAAGEAVETIITYENLPAIATAFDAITLKAIILDSQQNHQPYEAFTRRAMAAGVVGYFAFLSGKRVVYWGRLGDSHTEWFPQ